MGLRTVRCLVVSSLCLFASVASSGQGHLQLQPNVLVKGNPHHVRFFGLASGHYLIAHNSSHVNGIAGGMLVKVDQNGNVVTSFPKFLVDNHITKVHELPDGKLLVAGWFKNINGLNTSILRLMSDGSVDPTFQLFPSSAFENVDGFGLMPDGRILLFGQFDRGGLTFVVRMSSNGVHDPTFPLIQTGFFSHATIANGFLYGVSPTSILKYNLNGISQPGFPVAYSGGYISALTPMDTRIAVAGSFTSVNGVARNRFAVLQANGNVDSYQLQGIVGQNMIYEMNWLPDGRWFMGLSSGMWVFNGEGTTPTTVSYGGVSDMFVDQQQRVVLTGGHWQVVQGVSKPFSARLLSNLTIDPTFKCEVTSGNGITGFTGQLDCATIVGMDGFVYGMNQSDKNLARIKPDGTMDLSFNPEIPDAQVISHAIQPDGKIILVTGSDLVRLHASGKRDATYNTVSDVTGQSYYKMVKVRKEDTYLSGGFNSVKGHNSPGLVKLNENGNIQNTFRSTLGSGTFVADFDFQSDGKIIVGGTIMNGQKAVARLLPNGTVDPTFTTHPYSPNGVWKVAVDSLDRIYLGGGMHDFALSGHRYVVRLTPDGTIDNSFNPTLPFGHNITMQGPEVLATDKLVVASNDHYMFPALLTLTATGSLGDQALTETVQQTSITALSFNGESVYAGGILTQPPSTTAAVGLRHLYRLTGDVTNLAGARVGFSSADFTLNNTIQHGLALIIERSVDTNTNFQPIDSIYSTAPVFSSTGLSWEHGYYYRVRAANCQGSIYSNEFYLPPLPQGPPEPETEPEPDPETPTAEEDEPSVVEMPNVFTPNGDGSNAVFAPLQFKNVNTAHLRIFNRSGIEVFSTADPLSGWDGGGFPVGTYYFILSYTGNDEMSGRVNGWVQLIR